MKELTPNDAPTFESFWASLQESKRFINEQFAEVAQILKESSQQMKDWEQRQEAEEKKRKAEEKKRKAEEKKRKAEEKRRETKEEKRRELAEEKRREENERRLEKSDQRTKKLEELMGSWANNHGQFAEEYFANACENGELDFFGETFDDFDKNVKGIKKDYKDEYDILLTNGKAVGIIEVKFKAHEKDIPKILRKAQTFRVNFPEYQNHQIYLGLATMAFYPELEQECVNNGIAIVKQVGDIMVITDEHMRVF